MNDSGFEFRDLDDHYAQMHVRTRRKGQRRRRDRVIGFVRAAMLGLVTALAVVLFIVVFEGCDASWNKPRPINPEPGLPCGRTYFECPTGGCCDLASETCGREGYACGPGDCCFVGGDGPSWGSVETRHPQLTHEEAQRRDRERVR